MSVERRQLAPARVGYQRTFRFRVRKDGELVDLTGKSILAKIGTIFSAGAWTDMLSATVTIPTQTGDDRATFTALLTAAQATSARAGKCGLDIMIGDSATAEEPTTPRYQFELEAKETEA